MAVSLSWLLVVVFLCMNQSPVVNAVWINNIPSDLPSRTAFSLGFRNDLEVENVREEEYSVTVNRPYKNMAFILV